MEFKKWERGNLRPEYKLIAVRLNTDSEKDIIDALASVTNASGYIKALIRKDLNSNE